jgi:hypothetical protein
MIRIGRLGERLAAVQTLRQRHGITLLRGEIDMDQRMGGEGWSSG